MNRLSRKAWLAIGAAVALVLVVLAWPSGGGRPAVAGIPASTRVIDPNSPTRGVTSPPQAQRSVNLPVPAAGENPTQVVVVSVDGSCETPNGTIARMMDVGRQSQGRFTFFMSGLCLLPDDASDLYQPPGRSTGSSDIGFADPAMVERRIQAFSDMYRAGHEVGTHFLGHFCGASGVGTWTAEQWLDEYEQARTFLDTWAQNNPQVPAGNRLPFDSSVIQGGRTPCLEGDRDAMKEAFAKAGFRYDASDPGTLQWPRKWEGSNLWEFPLPALKLSGTEKWVLAMDYNLLVNQTDGEQDVPEETCRSVEEQTYNTYMEALEGVYNGNRAPLFVGSHLNDWACGAYITSLERFIVDAKQKHPDVQFVTFADLATWLSAMDPAVLADLQSRPQQKY